MSFLIDHEVNSSAFKAFLQKLYWRVFDGGEYYAKGEEMLGLLGKFRICEYRRSGRLWGNICFYRLEVCGNV